MPKITPAEYTIFCEEYFTKMVKDCPSYRFGQAFFNKFLTHDEEVDNLFYVTDTAKAQDIIWKNHIMIDTDYAEGK